MLELGFIRLKADYCAYLRVEGDTFALILVWVDDLLSFASGPAENDRVAQQIADKYDTKVIGAPSMLLGIHVHQDRENGVITLSQTHYIDATLERYGLDEARPVATPLDPNVVLQPAEAKETTATSQVDQDTRITMGYAAAIGSLMYAATATRPDIAYAVNTLAQFTSAPTATHWTALKRVFRYLKGTAIGL